MDGPGSFADFVVESVGADANDGAVVLDVFLVFVVFEAAADGVGVAEELAGEGLIDDGDGVRGGGVLRAEGAAAQDGTSATEKKVRPTAITLGYCPMSPFWNWMGAAPSMSKSLFHPLLERKGRLRMVAPETPGAAAMLSSSR